MKQLLIYLIFLNAFATLSAHAQKIIVCNEMSEPKMEYAGKELQRYIYQLSGELLKVESGTTQSASPEFILATNSNPLIQDLVKQGLLSDESAQLGQEGYGLHRINLSGKNTIVIRANTPIGCLYGVYGLLDDYYNTGFYMGGDVIPQQKQAFFLPEVNESKQPAMYIRGFLPWTNFPQSATVYSWEDWKFIIDQAAKMRMNFIHIHNYNGQNNHNEMYHNFTVNGYTSRSWMPTAKTGHRWGCPGFEVKNFRFGGGDLFGDYDFGADCALHNESLSNEEVFAKGTSMFKKVIAYAHERGVKIALGIDIDLVLPEYKLNADDPLVMDARINQITTDYPNLDYLILFVSEMINHDTEKLALWERTFDGMYNRMKKQSPDTRIAVAGWGLKKEIAQKLPADVIAAPISGYSDAFEDGSIYGNREYWGCPWLERDVYSSCYYYPYEMHLSNTINAYKNRASNMKGLYCLTWRLTDAVDAKLSYIAKAAWDTSNKYNSSYSVYKEYADKNYGVENADRITEIINQNEPMCSKISECESTAKFTGNDLYTSDYLYNLKEIGIYRMGQPLNRINATRYHWAFDIERHLEKDSFATKINSGDYLIFNNVDFGNGALEMSATVSTQNSNTCVEFRIDSLEGHTIGFIDVSHSGGWQNWSLHKTKIMEVKGKHNLYVICNSRDIFETPNSKANRQLKTIDNCIKTTQDKGMQQRLQFLRCRIAATKDYMDINKNFPHIDKLKDLPGEFPSWVYNFTHRVNDISSLGNTQSIQNRYVQERYLKKEKELMEKEGIQTPVADKKEEKTPCPVVVSPPTSVKKGQAAEISVRVLDSKNYNSVTAVLYYSYPRQKSWKTIPMERRTKAIFSATLPSDLSANFINYYIQISDGTQQAIYPATAPEGCNTLVYESNPHPAHLPAPQLEAVNHTLKWEPVKEAYIYKIYRTDKKTKNNTGAATFLTYVPAVCNEFKDAAPDFNGEIRYGEYQYTIIAEDQSGNQSKPSNTVKIDN